MEHVTPEPHQSGPAWGAVKEGLARVPNSQIALVLISVLAILALSTAIPFANDVAQIILVCAVALVFLLDVVLLFQVAGAMASIQEPQEVAERREALDSIPKHWVQHMSGNDPGVTIVSVKLDGRYGKYSLYGERLELDGSHRAFWKSEAIALESQTPPTFFYRWSGNSVGHPATESVDGDFTGIGFVSFDSETLAHGWFASGDLLKLDFHGRVKCKYSPLTRAEIGLLGDRKDFGELTARIDQRMGGHFPSDARNS